MNPEEIELIQQAPTSPEAFGKLYDTYYDRIFNYILRSTSDAHTSQDITAETFYKALKNIKKFKITKTGTFQAWLYKIALNEINQYFRKNKKYKFYPESEMEQFYQQEVPENEIANIAVQLDNDAEYKQIQKAIETLDEKYRNILFLRFFEKKQYAEISEITGIKESTLKSHLKRAVEQLQKALHDETGKTYTEGQVMKMIYVFLLFELVRLYIMKRII